MQNKPWERRDDPESIRRKAIWEVEHYRDGLKTDERAQKQRALLDELLVEMRHAAAIDVQQWFGVSFYGVAEAKILEVK